MLLEDTVQLLNREFKGREICFDPQDWFGGSALGVRVSWTEEDPAKSLVELKITPTMELSVDEVVIHLLEIESKDKLGESAILKELIHHEHGGRSFAYSARFEKIPSAAVCMLQASYV